jgi:glucose 1-dehydrogenase
MQPVTPQPNSLENQVVVITGAAQGIGAACARLFDQQGAKLVLIDQDFAPASVWLGKLQQTPSLIEGSVIQNSTLDRALEAAQRQGGAQVLINNAGITFSSSFLDLDIKDFDRVMQVNLRSYFLFGQAFAKQMVQNKAAGSIINMSSVNAVLAIAEQVPYVVSKGAVNQLTKVMAIGLAEHGIRVNAIGPGTIATELAKNAVLGSPAAKQKVMSRTPMGRMGEPEEIAAVALFLASGAASYFTGQTLYPDGGRLALNYSVAVAQ